MHTGRVKFYNDTKGFGFIIDDGSTEEVFFHISGLIDKSKLPEPKQGVTYRTEEGKKGVYALDIKLH